MPAYLIVYRESPLKDPAEYDEYIRKTRQMTGDFKLKPLSIYGAVEGLEGPSPDGVVMLEFPTVADAKAWYESPAYQDALPHRKRSAEWRAVLVEGL